jgi:hypothetical protein
MLIDKVKCEQFDKLYNYAVAMNDANKGFDDSFQSIIKEAELSFEVTLTRYEYLFLKYISTHVTGYEKDYFDAKNVKDTFQLSTTGDEPFATFYSLLCDVFDETNVDYRSYYLPSGMFTVTTRAVFRGEALLFITSLELYSFFKELFKTCVVRFSYGNSELLDQVLDDIELKQLSREELDGIFTSDKFNNFISSKFAKAFYSMLDSKGRAKIDSENNDIIKHNFYPSLSENDEEITVAPLSITSPYIGIDFLTDDGENIKEKLDANKKLMVPNYKTILNEETYIEYHLKTPFCIFQELFASLPNDRFLTKDPLIDFNKILHTDVPDPSSDIVRYSFNERFNGTISRYNEYAYKDLPYMPKDDDTIKDVLRVMELTPSYMPYEYNLRIKFSDFDNYLMSSDEEDMVSDYLSVMKKNTIEKMFKTAKAFYPLLRANKF